MCCACRQRTEHLIRFRVRASTRLTTPLPFAIRDVIEINTSFALIRFVDFSDQFNRQLASKRHCRAKFHGLFAEYHYYRNRGIRGNRFVYPFDNLTVKFVTYTVRRPRSVFGYTYLSITTYTTI